VSEGLMPHLPPVRGRLRTEVPLAPRTWLRVGGPAEVVFQPADAADLARSPCDQNGVGTRHPRTSGANTALNVSAASWRFDSILSWGDGLSPTRSTAGAAFWRARYETEYRD